VAFLIQFNGFLAFIQNFTAQNFYFFRGYLFAAAVYLLLVTLLTLIARRIRTGYAFPASPDFPLVTATPFSLK
jgi:ABC-type amino acid transport system permease subunit